MQENGNEQVTPSLWRRLVFGRKPKRTLIRAAVLGVTAFVVFSYFVLPARISGPSMEPTCRNGSIKFINRLAYWRHPPQRFDIVAVRIGSWDSWRALRDLITGHGNSRAALLKRVIALPGERVAIVRGRVLVNGEVLDEPYVKHRWPWEEPERKLGADEYLVIGDNRGMPQELHEHGVTTADRIAGKMLW